MRKFFLGLILLVSVLLAACGEPAPPPSPWDSWNIDYLACVRWRESNWNYSINTGNGYSGAYQFRQDTWNNVAAHIERWDLYGLPPYLASPYDQDLMANALVNWVGRNSASFGETC